MSQFKMLKVITALYQPRNNILFKREALLSHFIEGKLFEAVISEFLTYNTVKELVHHLRLAVQFFDLKPFKGLTLIYFVDLFLEFIEDPRHRSGVSLSIVDFKALACEYLNLRQVGEDVFFYESVILSIVYFQVEFVLRRRQIVDPHLCKRCMAADSNRLRVKCVLRTLSLLGCHDLFTHL